MTPDLFRDILFSLSGLSFGAASYAIYAHAALFTGSKNRPDTLGDILVTLSWILTVGAVFIRLIVPVEEIVPTVEGWLYLLGLVLGFSGFILLARAERRKNN